MSYNDLEVSTQDGRPAALYLIEWGKTRWRYTSADRPITIQENVDGVPTTVTYLPQAMKDSGMVQGSSSTNDFTVTAPANLPIVMLYRGTPPSETIWLTVRRKHVGEADTPIYWKGTIWNVKRNGPATAQIVGKPISSSLKRTGLRLCWTAECPHFLYDGGCKVEPEAHRVDAVVASLAGNTLTARLAAPISPEWFRGGFVSWVASDEGTLERRMIEDHSAGMVVVTPDNPATTTIDEQVLAPAATIIVFGLFDYLSVGQAIKLYPGCDRTPGVCDSKYDNIDNYGGFKDMPGLSPFNTAIW